MVGRPYLLRNCKESGVTHIMHFHDGSLEFVVMFESGYTDIDIRNYVLRQYIEYICFSRLKSFRMAVYCNCLVIGMYISCVYREVMWRCLISGIYEVFVKNGENMFACR